MAGHVIGMLDWKMQRDKESHRDYDVQWLLKADYFEDGPATMMSTPGLPAIGAFWALGNDRDFWAFCHPDWRVSPVHAKEKGYYWLLNQHFSTRPLRRCQDSTIDDPLAEPYKIRGTFSKYTEEATHDRNDDPLKYSSHEMIRGPMAEFDANRPQVEIEFNSLFLPLFAPIIDGVNDDMIWNCAPRTVKLSQAAWTRQLYGTCNFYYTASLGFDYNRKTWDRKVPDQGRRCLIDGLDPDDPSPNDAGITCKEDPSLFVAYKDVNGENGWVDLDGKGVPVGAGGTPHIITVEKYDEFNFPDLGVPTDFVLA